MRRRRFFRWVLGFTAAGLVALMFVGFRNPASLISVLDIGRLAEDTLPELLQRISNFHRIVTRDGERVIEVSATRADYFKDDRTVLVVEPRIVFYDKGVRAGELSGAEGRLVLNDGEIEKVTLEGTIVVELANFQLFAENVVYEHGTERILADGLVEIRSPEMTLTGRDLVIDVLERTFVMNSEVSMRIEGEKG